MNGMLPWWAWMIFIMIVLIAVGIGVLAVFDPKSLMY
jgi:hypothetical protein